MIKTPYESPGLTAMIHSKNAMDKIEFIYKLHGGNHYAARYKDQWYSAIFNPFSCMYYVDDKYGKFPDDIAAELEHDANIQQTDNKNKTIEHTEDDIDLGISL